MNCEILSTLYIKSNGDVLCNDDFGERVCLGKVDFPDQNWSVTKLFNNEKYHRIRDAFLNGILPWDNVCQRCAFLKTNESFTDFLSQKIIRKLQLEPSLACNLRCPCCANAEQVRTRPKPRMMSPELVESVLCSLRSNGFSLDWIEYCGQGEPLMHPQFKRFINIGREYFPNTRQRIITNGNFDYATVTGRLFTDEIIVSCDGLRQESYEKYRIKGDIKMALQFMSDVPNEIDNEKQNLVWKYILFEFNDNEPELLEAQHLAQELEVDTLLFVVTHSQYRSRKYDLESIGSLPVIYPNVTTNAHPSFYQGALTGKVAVNLSSMSPLLYRNAQTHLDEVIIYPGKILSLRGWVISKKQISHLKIYFDGFYIGTTVPSEERPDVEEAFPGYLRQANGFRFTSRLSNYEKGQAKIRFDIFSMEKQIARIQRTYNFSNT